MEVAEEDARITNLKKKRKKKKEANKKIHTHIKSQKQEREGDQKWINLFLFMSGDEPNHCPLYYRGKRRLYARENKPRAGHPFMAGDHYHCVEASCAEEEGEGGLGSDVGYTWLDSM